MSKEQQRAAHGINQFNHIHYHSEAADLIERWNGQLMSWLWCLLGVITLKGWGSVYRLHGCSEAREHCMVPSVPGPGIRGSGSSHC